MSKNDWLTGSIQIFIDTAARKNEQRYKIR
jgi:hypothetical protein